MRFHPYILALFCVGSLSIGQILFKIVSAKLTSIGSLAQDYRSLAILFFAFSLYGVSTIAWLFTLRSLPLSQAYLFMSLGFVIVPFLAVVIFGESLSLYHVIGTAVVIIGLIIATR